MDKQGQIIKLGATDSTNRFLRDLLGAGPLEDGTTVWAEHQWAGRGQRGASWESEEGKNLTFSILKHFNTLTVERQFVLVMGVSLAICKLLEAYQIPDVKIKWPNDIMSGNRKISGILIENLVVGPRIRHAIIGVGLNVNQEHFGALPRAGSMRSVSGTEFEREGLLEALLLGLRANLDALDGQSSPDLMPAYRERLFRRDLASAFVDGDGRPFMGILRGVGDMGNLLIELEDGTLRKAGPKEVVLRY